MRPFRGVRAGGSKSRNVSHTGSEGAAVQMKHTLGGMENESTFCKLNLLPLEAQVFVHRAVVVAVRVFDVPPDAGGEVFSRSVVGLRLNVGQAGEDDSGG